jgi:SAM-dependent methyltransferase
VQTNDTMLRKNTTCIACNGANLVPCLDLGHQPLANSYTETNINLPKYPLNVHRCTDCYHLQLTHTVPPADIYTNYLYRAGTSETLKKYSYWFAEFVIERMGFVPAILDVGCNDGTQLDCFWNFGAKTYGIDPAENLAQYSKQNNQIAVGFFKEETVNQLGDVKFDVINNQNAFSHMEDPTAFLQLAKTKLNPGGRIFISTSQANMVLNNEFDTIYHEHISFYNVCSMKRLAERNGLFLTDVIKTPIHGVSYIFEMRSSPANRLGIENWLAMETSQGLYNEETYQRWPQAVSQIKNDFIDTVTKARSENRLLVGYGAAAKGNTFLNYVLTKLDAIIDDSPLKQGLVTPGMQIPIYDLSTVGDHVDLSQALFIPLAWNFFDEIQCRLNNHLGYSAEFVRYFPKVEVVK